MTGMIVWQRLEGAVILFAAIAIYLHLNPGFAWWSTLLLFMAPDLSFAGYLAGPRVGALAYNLVHVFAFGTGLLALGLVLDHPLVAAMGALWFAHAGFDRMLGYGLKSGEGFTITHLGRIGRARPE